MMFASDISRVTKELIGKVVPIAETYYDTKAKSNLNKLGDVTYELVCDIIEVTEYYDSQFGSCEECGKDAVEILEKLKREIDDCLDSIKNNTENK